MSSNLRLAGVYVPLITPFTSDGSVALDEVGLLSEAALDSGAAGLVALGTTGEPATLTHAEKSAVIERIGAACRERGASFIIGAGSNDTAGSEKAVADASSVTGVSALLVVTPYYTLPSEAGVVQHFKTLATASAVPLVIYNIPYRTGRGLGIASLLELAATPNIAGVKQAVGGIDAATLEVMAQKPDDFHILCGDDPFIYSFMTSGASGAIAASSNVLTESFVELVDRASKGDYTGARAISKKLLPVARTLFVEPSPGVIKGVLAARGFISEPSLRLPMTAASEASVKAALDAIEAAR